MAPRKLTDKTRALAWKIDVIDTKAVLKKGKPCGGPVRINPASLPGPLARALNREARRILAERAGKISK